MDISIFTTMSDILKKKISDHKIEVNENNHEIEILEERINGLNNQLNALRENREKKIKDYESTVEETQNNIDKILGDVDEKTKDVVEKKSTIKDKDPQGDRLKQATELERQLQEAVEKQLRMSSSTRKMMTARHVNRAETKTIRGNTLQNRRRRQMKSTMQLHQSRRRLQMFNQDLTKSQRYRMKLIRYREKLDYFKQRLYQIKSSLNKSKVKYQNLKKNKLETTMSKKILTPTKMH